MRRYQGETLLTICNYTDERLVYNVPEELQDRRGEVLISNYDRDKSGREFKDREVVLDSYEAIVVLYGKVSI